MFRRGDNEDRHGAIQTREVPDVRGGDSSGSGEVTVVGQGARLEGTIVSAGSLRIDGQVKGKVQAEGDVTLTPSSQVEADIHAQNVVVAGKFRGNVVAKGRAELARGAQVEGNVTSKMLVIAEGAVFSGQSIMGSDEHASAGRSAPAGRPAEAPQPDHAPSR